jgi:hypothetical protein
MAMMQQLQLLRQQSTLYRLLNILFINKIYPVTKQNRIPHMSLQLLRLSRVIEQMATLVTMGQLGSKVAVGKIEMM